MASPIPAAAPVTKAVCLDKFRKLVTFPMSRFSLVLAHSSDSVFIQITAQPRLLRYFKITILRMNTLPSKFIAQGSSFFRDIFRDKSVGNGVQEVQCSSYVNVCSKTVVGHGNSAVSRHGRDFHGLSESTTASKIHLDDINGPFVKKALKGMTATLLFTRGNPDLRRLGKLVVTHVIVCSKGFFQPKNVGLRKCPGTLNSGFCVPYQARVNH